MTNKIVGDYARLSFPEHYRKLEIARAGEIARAEELARIEARREHETVPSHFRKQSRANEHKTLTAAQTRTKKIRVWMLSQSSRPDLATYRQAMDAAKVLPPPACLHVGKRSFEESTKVAALRHAISAEFSRLWKTR
jgi:hypothetical protein